MFARYYATKQSYKEQNYVHEKRHLFYYYSKDATLLELVWSL